MRLYFYAKTDNRLGLDRLRRVVALLKEFDEVETYLMTTEFRSATYAKEVLGVKKAVGIEDFRNVGTVAQNGDILIYDSDEHNETIHQEMIDYFGTFFRISYDPKDLPKEGEYLISPYVVGENVINGILIESGYFCSEPKEHRTFFYGDDDYERTMLTIAPSLKEFELELLEGAYFFVDMQEKLKDYFKKIYESEEYVEILKKSSLFISASPQSALEAAAAGAKVVYIQREDQDDEYMGILERVGIQNIGYFDKGKLQEALLLTTLQNAEYIEKMSIKNVAKRIKEIVNLNIT